MRFKCSFLVVSILVAAFSSACLDDRIKLTCDGGAKINGRDFGCDVCYEELGCARGDGEWTCPAGVELSCSFNDETLEYCCGGKCIDCGEDAAPQTCTGYTGADEDCCRTDDPCGLASNGTCDCDDTCAWERRECSPIKVDVLAVVDNSMSMDLRQQIFINAFGGLITSLLDPSGGTPVRDLHLGVVSTDMGVGGYTIPTCEDSVDGDDGVLLDEPHGEGCAAAYPSFLEYAIGMEREPDTEAMETIAADFGCIARLGTNGCGWEQQLEAAFKALTVHSIPTGANKYFLRDDSILVILFLTDEEDCSASDMSIFDTAGIENPINLQCHLHPDMLHPVSRYADGLRGLRSSPDDLIAGFIVGVPPGETACEGSGDAVSGCLGVPAMEERINADGNALEFSCTWPPGCTFPSDCSIFGFPPRRFVQLAQQLGDKAVVRSICQDSYEPFMQDVAQKVRRAIGD
ncbi:MAG: hypothetical protein ABIJ56_00920 [Pseudomonadota bacterium]